MVAITKGLTSGQTVVVDGADQLRDGAKIMLPQAPGAGAGGDGTHPRRNGAGSSSGGNGASAGSSGGSDAPPAGAPSSSGVPPPAGGPPPS